MYDKERMKAIVRKMRAKKDENVDIDVVSLSG